MKPNSLTKLSLALLGALPVIGAAWAQSVVYEYRQPVLGLVAPAQPDQGGGSSNTGGGGSGGGTEGGSSTDPGTGGGDSGGGTTDPGEGDSGGAPDPDPDPEPAVGVFSSSPAAGATIDFGQVAVETSGAQLIQISNTGQGALPLSVGTPSAPFSVDDNCPLSLAPAATCTVTVTFAPDASDVYEQSSWLDIVAGTDTYSYSLAGFGEPPAVGVFSASPGPGGTLAFGQVTVETSVTRQVQVSNTGYGPLPLAIGTLAAPFSVADDCPSELAPSTTCTVTVTLTPTSSDIGALSRQLDIVSNDVTYSYPLTATGRVAGLSSWTSGGALVASPHGQRGLVSTPLGLFYVETANARVFRSTNNGASWTSIALPTAGLAGAVSSKRIAYGNNTFIVTGVIGNIEGYWRSTNGTTWTWSVGNGLSEAETIRDIVYGNGMFMAFSTTGPNYWTSSDGSAWTQRSSGWSAARAMAGAAHGDGITVLTGYGNWIRVSENGINWRSVSNSNAATTTLQPPYYIGNRRFAIPNDQSAYFSSVGVTSFTNRGAVLSTPTGIRGFSYGGGTIVAYADSGRYSSSTDTVNWSATGTAPVSDAFRAVHFDGTRFMFMGSNIQFAQ